MSDVVIVGRGINDVAVVVLTLSPAPEAASRWNDKDLYELADKLRTELMKTDNVGLTYISGGSPQQIRVEPSPEKLALYGITLQQLVAKVRDLVMGAVKASFRPEFLNRLDEIILFQRLKREQMAAIVDIQLGRLEKLLVDRKITLKLDDLAKAWLANQGYDPAYGARPLKRVIQRAVQDPLAEMILAGTVRDGDTVAISAAAGGLLITGATVRAAA